MSKQIAAILNQIIYIPNDNVHTVRYAEMAKRVTTLPPRTGNYKMVVGPELVVEEVIGRQVRERLRMVYGSMIYSLSDFRYNYSYEIIENNQFWSLLSLTSDDLMP